MHILADLRKHELIYVGTPYTKYRLGPELAFRHAAALMADLIRAGLPVYSPIAHTHPIAVHGGLDPLDHTIWLPFNLAIMRRSDALLVLMMEGWQESTGVAHEIRFFQDHAKPVYLFDPVTRDLQTESLS